MPFFYKPHQGAVPDPKDGRDFPYKEVLAADDHVVNWERGYLVYEDLDIPLEQNDQGSSSSCVGQASDLLYRSWVKKFTGKVDANFSSKAIYSQIALPQGGAYLRDGVKLLSEYGCPLEMSVTSYEKYKPPTEAFMRDLSWKTPVVDKESLKYETFTYRMIPGDTGDIDSFAHAVRNEAGVLAGYTGTNEGWTKKVVMPPQPGERKWGHAVYVCGYGIFEEEKCLFTPNSWGGRYTIKNGRFKGLQAIPERYFQAGISTADGIVAGGYVFNAWTLVPDEKVPEAVRDLDLSRKLEGEFIFEAEEKGEFALVQDGLRRKIKKSRLGEAAMLLGVKSHGVIVNRNQWTSIPKGEDF